MCCTGYVKIRELCPTPHPMHWILPTSFPGSLPFLPCRCHFVDEISRVLHTCRSPISRQGLVCPKYSLPSSLKKFEKFTKHECHFRSEVYLCLKFPILTEQFQLEINQLRFLNVCNLQCISVMATLFSLNLGITSQWSVFLTGLIFTLEVPLI